jgi:hypothetical protein
MWIMGVLSFLPVASTINLGLYTPSRNFPVGWNKIPACKSPASNNKYFISSYFHKVLGMGQPWKGGNMKSVGGGFKLLKFKETLQPYAQNKDMVVLLTDR